MATQNSYHQILDLEDPVCLAMIEVMSAESPASNLTSDNTRKRSCSEEVSLEPAKVIPRCDVYLDMKTVHMWQAFQEVGGMEMVISKPGRRMFPCVSVRVCGLLQQRNYSFKMRIVPVDNLQYKYVGESKWVGKAGARDPEQSLDYIHPDSPALGLHWENGPISFNNVKLANTMSAKTNVVLTSMHKYIVQIIVEDMDSEPPHKEDVFTMPNTVFMSVTAYLNPSIIRMKNKYNPYAKAHHAGKHAASKGFRKDQKMFQSTCTQCCGLSMGSCSNSTISMTGGQPQPSTSAFPDMPSLRNSLPANSICTGCPTASDALLHGLPPSNEAGLLRGQCLPKTQLDPRLCETMPYAFAAQTDPEPIPDITGHTWTNVPGPVPPLPYFPGQNDQYYAYPQALLPPLHYYPGQDSPYCAHPQAPVPPPTEKESVPVPAHQMNGGNVYSSASTQPPCEEANLAQGRPIMDVLHEFIADPASPDLESHAASTLTVGENAGSSRSSAQEFDPDQWLNTSL